MVERAAPQPTTETKDDKRFQYFVCGPLAMMDAMEKVLPDMGIAPEYIHTERFDIV